MWFRRESNPHRIGYLLVPKTSAFFHFATKSNLLSIPGGLRTLTSQGHRFLRPKRTTNFATGIYCFIIIVASVRIELTSAESESAIINRYTTRQYCWGGRNQTLDLWANTTNVLITPHLNLIVVPSGFEPENPSRSSESKSEMLPVTPQDNIFEPSRRVELLSHPYQGCIIAVILWRHMYYIQNKLRSAVPILIAYILYW